MIETAPRSKMVGMIWVGFSWLCMLFFCLGKRVIWEERKFVKGKKKKGFRIGSRRWKAVGTWKEYAGTYGEPCGQAQRATLPLSLRGAYGVGTCTAQQAMTTWVETTYGKTASYWSKLTGLSAAARQEQSIPLNMCSCPCRARKVYRGIYPAARTGVQPDV